MKKKKFYSLIAVTSLVVFCGQDLNSQGIYNNGGKIIVGPGATLYISGTAGNFRNETGALAGSVELNGTLRIDGNVVNNAAASDIFSYTGTSGSVELTGTLPQTLGGSTSSPFTFNNLTVNNAAGVALGNNTIVNGNLSLTSGLLDIGASNFTFGPAASLAGTPSSSAMIVATGTGQVQRLFSSPGSFTFPVGDNYLTPEYSPVSIDLTAGTFSPGSFVGINLVNGIYPDPAITGSYLARYWNISQTGISGFTCNALFQYLPADITGTEADIFGLMINPPPPAIFSPSNTALHQLTATGLTSFGTFTGGPGTRTLNLTLFVEGLWNGSGTMRQAQGLQGNQFPGSVADQVTVELHNSTNYSIVDYTAPNLDISTAGLVSAKIPWSFNSSYYLAVKHRNSLVTVSGTPVSFGTQAVSYDFSTTAAQAFGSNMINKAGVFAFYGGDVSQDGLVDLSDMVAVDNKSTQAAVGYLTEDVNGDGLVDISDMIIVDNNSRIAIGAITP